MVLRIRDVGTFVGSLTNDVAAKWVNVKRTPPGDGDSAWKLYSVALGASFFVFRSHCARTSRKKIVLRTDYLEETARHDFLRPLFTERIK